MYRFMLTLLTLSTALGVAAGPGHAESSLRNALAERFRLSRIEVQNPSDQGAVIRTGTVLRLQADGVPANPIRSVQLNTKSPRFHVRDYARVEVGVDGALVTGPGVLSLRQDTRLVVLDLKVSGDRVRLFTHTLKPVPLLDGRVSYGCTEFVFAFGPGTLDRSDIGTITGRIDQVLTLTSAS